MIDITPYQQRLEWLREWISDRIDGKISPPIWVDVEALKFNLSVKEILDIYQATGMLFFKAKDIIENKAIPISFQEYCKYKQSLCQSQST